MNLNKICPVCKTEYMPHIINCADCGAVLLLPEEQREAQTGKDLLTVKTVETTAVVREGSLDWIKELRDVLMDDGIPCTIHSDISCKKGCRGGTCRLVVSTEDLERAQQRVEEYFMEIDPAFQTSHDLMKDGKCPACGSSVGTGDRDCPDCGLPLLIIEEEEE